MRKLAYIFCIALFLFGCATLEDMQKRVQQNPISSDQNAAFYAAIQKLKAGNQFKKNGQNDKAMENYQQALTIFRKLEEEETRWGGIASALTSMGEHRYED
jgi:hypothetical protein